MTDRENEIYNGLKAIGSEIAAFFYDAVQITQLDFETKPYLLGHLSREIESGLRQVLVPKIIDNKNESGGAKKDKGDGHKKSILKALNIDQESVIATKWHTTAEQFHKYAHRNGVWKDPREKDSFDKLWADFLDILEYLVGNYYALVDRLDSISKMQTPTEEILGALPNFLNSELKQQYFFGNLKSIEWLDALYAADYFKGVLNPDLKEVEGKPGTFYFPYWGALAYLEEVAKQNVLNPSVKISQILSSIIDGIINYKREDGTRVNNFRTDYTIFKLICSLPEQYIKEYHFQFISDAIQNEHGDLIGYDFGSLLERLIEIGNKELLLSVVNVLLSYKYLGKDSYEKVNSIFKEYDLSPIISQYKGELIEICGFEMLNICTRHLNEIINLETTFYEYSIDRIEREGKQFEEDSYIFQIVYLIVDILEKLPAEKIAGILESFSTHKDSIFRRISIYIISKRYEDFKSFFWKWVDNPFNDLILSHELNPLINNFASDFSTEELDKLLKWIDEINFDMPRETKEQIDKADLSIAHEKEYWLKMLLIKDNERISKLISNLNIPPYPELHEPPLLSLESITDLTLEECITYYNDFSKKTDGFRKPSTYDFVDLLVSTIRKNPYKYAFNCDSIAKAPIYLQYAWIRGLNEAWNDEKLDFNCDDVFKNIYEIISDPTFWESYNSNKRYYTTFLSNMFSFLDDGLRDDSHAFDMSHLPLIKKLLFIIIENDKQQSFDYIDLSMQVLNNPKGRLYMTLIQYSLRLARTELKDKNRWDEDVKKFINDIVISENEAPLAFYVFGKFLPNIAYLDKSWLLDSFQLIFPINNEVNWSAAMMGYLYFYRNPHEEYFKLFHENGHYEKAIDSEMISTNLKDSLINHICSGYLHSLDGMDLEGQLMNALIRTKVEKSYSAMIYFFWNPNFTRGKEASSKIKPIWEKIFTKAIKLEDLIIDRYMISACCKWVNSIPEIDQDVFDWMKLSAPYISQRDRTHILQGLSKHISTSPEKVGSILIEIFENEIIQDISRGKVLEMVTFLYENGHDIIANKICLIHGEKGAYFLRPVYNKFNNR